IMFNSAIIRGLLTGIALTLGSVTTTYAAALNLSYSTTGDYGQTGSGTQTNISSSDLYFYGNAFGNLTTPLYTPDSGPYAGMNFEFYDDYIFTIAGGSVSTISASVNLGDIYGIENFQARLYSFDSNPLLPVLGTPVGGAIDAWSTTYTGILGSSVTVNVLDNVQLGAGTYVLELRGAVANFGGSYGGILHVAAVPVPAAAWLMGSAMLGLFGVRRRSK
ncbi:MAG TPA: VPLPA-CTERM sorting domain-containing protein, partial [Spongiibacteraceae bacterium]|nr:VPLPA-CTERM sorting domain-containing protein [Spongiibacteraceae bacterium]